MSKMKRSLAFFLLASLTVALLPLLAIGQASKDERDLAAFDAAAVVGQRRWLRTLIHVHSVQSHDACDGKPSIDGQINGPCLTDFRAALCRNHHDVVFLTEHRDSMARVDFSDVAQVRGDDEPIVRHGVVVGSRQHCPDGHVVNLFTGAENKLMPLGLLRHPDTGGANLESFYNQDTPAAVKSFRDAGALVAVNHAERRTYDNIATLQPDALELYNPHANLSRVWRQPRSWSLIKQLTSFFVLLADRRLEADQAFMIFFREDEETLTKWARLVQSRHVTGIFGTDAHQNVLPILSARGERVDAYHSNCGWFSNFVQVDGETTRESVMDAVKRGRVYTAFEIFGTPRGFRFEGEAAGKKFRMGDIAPISAGVRLHAALPHLDELRSSGTSGAITLKILRATAGGWVAVATSSSGDIDFVVTQPGPYRAEVRMKLPHLKGFLAGETSLIRDVPWVYSNPIYVQ